MVGGGDNADFFPVHYGPLMSPASAAVQASAFSPPDLEMLWI